MAEKRPCITHLFNSVYHDFNRGKLSIRTVNTVASKESEGLLDHLLVGPQGG